MTHPIPFPLILLPHGKIAVRGLTYIRLQRRVTQRQLALFIGKDQAKICLFERFKKEFSLKNLQKLSTYFEVEIEAIRERLYLDLDEVDKMKSELVSEVNSASHVKQRGPMRINAEEVRESNQYNRLLSCRWVKGGGML